MPDQDIDSEDVSAMRREGDFKAFLREGIRQGKGVFSEGLEQFRRQSSRPPEDLPDATGHIPGAWPVSASGARGTCSCTRCQSYGKEQPAPEELLRRTQEYLDGPSA